MAVPLNILIVEDSPDDAELFVKELRRAGYAPKWKRVDTEPDFLAELENNPDLILSDHSMPQFSGLRAADCLRQRGLDIPFILISGTIGEDAAVEAMKHGVADYLLKDRIGRLGNVVKTALEQRRLREEHKRMQQQLTLQATALETAANAIIVTDRQGRILWVNPAFTVSTGYTPAEVIGKTPRVLKSGEHSEEFYHDFWKTISSGQSWSGEFINRRKDGSLCYDEHTVTPVRSQSGAITHFVGIMHDITARRSAEAAARMKQEWKTRHQTGLLKLASQDRTRFELALREILKTSALTLGVGRASYWSAQENLCRIFCEALYLAQTDTCESGSELRREDFPRYFQSLEENPLIAAADAQTDLRTAEFSDSYLKPLGIASMLDVPVWLRGKLVGVVCHEHLGKSRAWSADEQDFALSIGHMVSLALGERELLLREQRLNSFFSNAAVGLCILGSDLKYIQVNEAMARMNGYPVVDHIGKSVLEMVPRLAAIIEPLLQGVVATGRPVFDKELSGETPAEPGVTQYWVSSFFPLVGSDGRSQEIGAVVMDVTARRRAELLAMVFSNLGQRLNHAKTPAEAACIVKDVADELLGWDAFTLDRYSPEKDRIYHVLNCDTVDGRRIDVPPAYDDASPSPLARRVIEEGAQLILRPSPESDTTGIPFGDTSRRSASLLFAPIRDGKRVVGVLSIQSYRPNAYEPKDLEVLQSVADHCSGALERIQATEMTRESEARFRQLAENINEVFWITDPTKNQMLYVSPAYEAVWGRFCASLIEYPGTWLEAIHPEDRDRVLEAALNRQVNGEYDETYRIVRPDGSLRWIHDRAFPIRDASGKVYRIVGVATDMTRQRNLEQQFRHIQKMESIGQLAAGVAHDFNNILAVIRGNAELALMDANPASEDLIENLKQITAASERAANLTRQLLMFGHKQVMQERLLDLNEVVGNMIKMLKRILGEDVELEVRCGSNLPTVRADVGMMEQVVMNLAVNARDAMPQGGRLVISTSDAQIEESYVQLNPQAVTGDFVCLSVSDTGCGIPPDIQSRIFDPFFTTKGVGKGTGLGLATVYGIVQQHKGWITVYSEVGQGAVFRIYLPVAGTPAKDRVQTEVEAEIKGGNETILLAEDEAAVRALMRNVLERYGYSVIEAESGVKALDYWKQQQESVDLVLTDMIMPDGMTGRQLAERIHSDKPALPIIYTSGYSADIVGKDFELKEGVNFLQKPCAPRKLAAAVRHSLDARKSK